MTSPDKPWLTVIGRNTSWLQSIKLTFARPILYAPTALWHLIGDGLKTLGIGLFCTIAAFLVWASYTILYIIAGLAGFLKLPTENNQ